MKNLLLLVAALSVFAAAAGCGEKTEDVDMSKIKAEEGQKGQGSQNVPTEGINN